MPPAFLRRLSRDRKLSRRARQMIGDEANRVVVNAASAWEIAARFNIGRLPEAEKAAHEFSEILAAEAYEPFGICVEHARSAGLLPPVHRDPFDRILVAQALSEGLPFVSNDEIFDRYGMRRIW
jgi:PIN domain nuclease of toxin-antitoxin system